VRRLIVAASMAASAVALTACPPDARTVVDVIGESVCILNHSGEPVAQIIEDCGKEGYTLSEGDVTKVVTAHRAAAEREASRGRLLDAGSDR
jgi:hypothetical protein